MSRRVRLADIAQARCGDKGDIANIALFAPDEKTFRLLLQEVTIERVRAHFGDFVRGRVERFPVPNVHGINFVLHEALDGGAANSLRTDALGKSLGSLLLRLEIDIS